MIKILFRGKTIRRGEWVEGYVRNRGEGVKERILIGSDFFYDTVDPETVGQYTGIDDVNGVKIFEDDIVKMHYFLTDNEARECDREIIGRLGFGLMSLVVVAPNGEVFSLQDYVQDPNQELEVIGNIYDNPEWNCQKENAQ